MQWSEFELRTPHFFTLRVNFQANRLLDKKTIKNKKDEQKIFGLRKKPKVDGRINVSSNEEDKSKKGLEGTSLILKSASTDEDFTQILTHIKSSKTPAVINYGASWCRVCSHILPAFCGLSNKFPKLSFIYADIDECSETTQHIRYTPTFQFFRDGEKVDEMYGTGEERLHDRLWLHS